MTFIIVNNIGEGNITAIVRTLSTKKFVESITGMRDLTKEYDAGENNNVCFLGSKDTVGSYPVPFLVEKNKCYGDLYNKNIVIAGKNDEGYVSLTPVQQKLFSEIYSSTGEWRSFVRWDAPIVSN